MGWFDGSSQIGVERVERRNRSRDSTRKHSSSKSHSGGSIFGLGDSKHHSSSRSGGSIFGLGDSKHHSSSRSGGSIFGLGDSKHNASRSSFFGGKSTHKRAAPRRGYLSKMYAQIRHLFRKLLYYLKHNPMKVFMLVIMPLITGGALTGLLKQFGVRLPAGVERMISKFGGGGGSDVGRGAGGGLQWERKSYDGPLGGLGSAMGGAGQLLSVAKMFM